MTDRACGRRRRFFCAAVEIVAASRTGFVSLYDNRQRCTKQRKQAFSLRNVDLKGNHIVSRSSYFAYSPLYTSNIHDLFESRFARLVAKNVKSSVNSLSTVGSTLASPVVGARAHKESCRRGYFCRQLDLIPL